MRYYFDFENGSETLRDNEGAEAGDLRQVLADALDVIQEVAEEVVAERPEDVWMLVVRDETGAPVAYLPVRQVSSAGCSGAVRLSGRRY
jgi:hypothetical protein